MSRTRSRTRIDRDDVATMLTMAGLELDEGRLEELAGLLQAASDAATNLDAAASRVPLSEGMAEYDPAWPAGERQA